MDHQISLWSFVPIVTLFIIITLQEADLIRLKREAKANNGYYVEPEGKLAFVVRIRGINDMHPKSRKILQLLRLRQIHNGTFLRVRLFSSSSEYIVGPFQDIAHEKLQIK